MKKKISCALLAMLLAGQVMGAVSVEAGETKTTSTAVDSQEKNTVVKYTAVERLAPQFESVNGLSDEGILTVKKGDKWGFVDITGKTIIDYKYDYASEMVDGVAVVGYLSEKEPYVDKETGESYEYYILYIVDKTGKETQLFLTEEQNYRYEPGDDYWAHDENGNFIVEVSRDELEDIFIHDGVIRVVSYFEFIYRYDGTPIYVKDTEKLDALLAESWNGFRVGTADYHVYFESNDGLIPMRVSNVYDQSPLSIVIDMDGNIVYTYPMMDRGDITQYNYEEGTIPYGLKNTPEEYGVSYTYAPEDGYVVAYNSHFNAYSKTYGDETVYNNGYGVMNADGEWVIEPVYDSVWVIDDMAIRDGYVTLKNHDGKWGVMSVEGEMVIPFEYRALTYINGYAWLFTEEEDGVGTCVDMNGQTYTFTDADGNTIEFETSYLPADNNVRRMKTADDKTYLLSGTPDGTTFKTIEGTEDMNIYGWRSSSGKYWTTKTEAGYGVIEIVVEETEVAPVEETKPAETEEKTEEKVEEVIEKTETTKETKSTTSKNFPIRNGSTAAKSKQNTRTNTNMSGLSAMVRH